MNELKALWGRLLGRIPSDQQFDFWSALHSPEVIRQGILKTTQKNLSVGGTMSEDHKTRFASKVMLTLSAQREENVANSEKLSQEFEGQVQQ
jgi:hypothetical protein